MSEGDHSDEQPRSQAFPATHWTLIRGVQSDSPDERKKALEELCRSYWYPLYVFARRRGLSVEEAEDAVQDCFVRMLARESFATADREKGRLRTWLLTQMSGCLADRARRRGRQKRGGNLVIESFDALVAEDRYRREPANHDSPDAAFEAVCAKVLANEVLAELRGEYFARQQAERFDALLPLLFSEGADERELLRVRLGLKDGALRVALHRLRDAFAARLRRRLELLTDNAEELDAEAAAIIGVLSR